MTEVNMHEAGTQPSKLADAAERGKTVIIARSGKPTIRLEPVGEAKPRWSPEALAFFSSAPTPELTDFSIPGDDLLPAPERNLF